MLARSNQVYTPFADPFAIEKSKGEVTHRLEEIRLANTFTGFCATHDAEVFRRIDRGLEAPDLEQAFLLHYRALCRELYTRRAACLGTELLRDADQGKTEEMQRALQTYVSSFQSGYKRGLLGLECDKKVCDEILEAAAFGRMRSFVIKLGSLPTIACSGITQPVSDFAGKWLQDLSNFAVTLSRVSLSLLPTSAGGIAVLAWLEEADSVGRRFADSLDKVADDDKSSALAQWVFDSFENHAIKPEWWEGLKPEKRRQIQMLLRHWTSNIPISSEWLVPSTLKLATWDFVSSYWL